MKQGYFTNQRLKFINDTVNELDPEVKLLDPSRVNFVPLQQELSRLDLEVSNQKRRVDFLTDDSKKWQNGAKNTLDDMNKLEEDVVKEIGVVNNIVSRVQSLATNMDHGTGPKVDSALAEAEEIIKSIQKVSFREFRDAATDDSIQANILVSEMMDYNGPVNDFTESVNAVNERISVFGTKIDDLQNITKRAREIASNAEKLNSENRLASTTGNLGTVKNLTSEIKQDIAAGVELNKNASVALDEAVNNINSLGN